MSCPTCGRREVAGACNDGFVHYLSGDFPCAFNKRDTSPRNLRVLAPLPSYNPKVPAEMSAEGLEDLL